MTKVKKPRKLSDKQVIIKLLLGENASSCNWALEMKLLGQAMAKFPEVPFWLHFGEKNHYATLIHLLSDVNDTNIVSKAYIEYTKNLKLTLKTPEAVKLESEKIGQDIIYEKPKTLKDFLK